MQEKNKAKVLKLNNGKLVINIDSIIIMLLRYGNYEYSFGVLHKLIISRDVVNTPKLGDVDCIQITYICGPITNIQYFHSLEYIKAAMEFKNRLLSDDPSIFSISGSTLEDIKKSNEQIKKEISSKDKTIHEIDSNDVVKSLCVNGCFTYKHGDSCYASITIHDNHQESGKVIRKLLITFINQINEEAYTRFIPIESLNLSVDVFLKLLKTNEVVFQTTNN